MHRAALAFAIAGFLAQQLGEHAVDCAPFGQAMPVAAMRAGDVIVRAQRFANAHGDRFLADIKVGEARHQGARVEIVDLLLEQADHHHAAVHAQEQLVVDVTHVLYSFAHSRHSREHFEQDGEILLRQAHAARSRQHFVGRGGGRQRHVHLAAQLQCE